MEAFPYSASQIEQLRGIVVLIVKLSMLIALHFCQKQSGYEKITVW